MNSANDSMGCDIVPRGKKERKPKQPKKKQQEVSTGMIKANNKLIGEVQNTDLYAEDELDGFGSKARNAQIDFKN